MMGGQRGGHKNNLQGRGGRFYPMQYHPQQECRVALGGNHTSEDANISSFNMQGLNRAVNAIIGQGASASANMRPNVSALDSCHQSSSAKREQKPITDESTCSSVWQGHPNPPYNQFCKPGMKPMATFAHPNTWQHHPSYMHDPASYHSFGYSDEAGIQKSMTEFAPPNIWQHQRRSYSYKSYTPYLYQSQRVDGEPNTEQSAAASSSNSQSSAGGNDKRSITEQSVCSNNGQALQPEYSYGRGGKQQRSNKEGQPIMYAHQQNPSRLRGGIQKDQQRPIADSYRLTRQMSYSQNSYSMQYRGCYARNGAAGEHQQTIIDARYYTQNSMQYRGCYRRNGEQQQIDPRYSTGYNGYTQNSYAAMLSAGAGGYYGGQRAIAESTRYASMTRGRNLSHSRHFYQ